MKELKEGSSIFMFDNCITKEFANEIIEFFDEDPQKVPGCTVNSNNELVRNPEFKNSHDLFISIQNDPETYAPIYKKLRMQIEKDMQKLFKISYSANKYLNNGGSWEVIEFKVQKTKKGDICFREHIDRSGFYSSTSNRELVFIYYLTDIEEGGGTHFKAQDVTVESKCGRLVFFPPYWTHPHEGLDPISHDKYIITGWVSRVY